jgi:hypothetical protein
LAFRRNAIGNSQSANPLDDSDILLLDEDSDGNRQIFAIHYLQEVMKSASESGVFVDTSVQHALIWFLAKYDEENERELLNLFMPMVETDAVYGEAGILLDRDAIDLSFALRVCRRADRKRTCVYIYVLLNMFEKAVALALEIDMEFAKSIASRPVDYAVGKKLWLSIVQRVIATEAARDSSRVLDALKESKGLVRIEVR